MQYIVFLVKELTKKKGGDDSSQVLRETSLPRANILSGEKFGAAGRLFCQVAVIK